MDVEQIATIAVDCGLRVHRELGPGMLEEAYEAVLAHALMRRGLFVERQKAIPIRFEGEIVDKAFRIDLLIERQLLIELKSVDRLSPVFGKQVLTYLRFLDLRIGLLMNFGMPTFREGLKRIVNGLDERPSGYSSSRPWRSSRETDPPSLERRDPLP